MALTKTEINLRRLLAALPNQTNQAKLAHYIVTLKEQLAELTGENGQRTLACISKEKAREYAEQIELAASKLNILESMDVWGRLAMKSMEQKAAGMTCSLSSDLIVSKVDKRRGVDFAADLVDKHSVSPSSAGLRHRHSVNSSRDDSKTLSTKYGTVHKSGNQGPSVKVDSATLQLIDKHRQLQENLTDEMADLARQMKEASISMNQAVLDSEKILDSTERAVEHSLASTNQANKRAQNIYKQSFKTGWLTWLLIFIMTCMFLMMVFLIRIT